MKRYINSFQLISEEPINASVFSTREYEKVHQRDVTRGYLQKSGLDIPGRALSRVIDGILKWKSQKRILYHHKNNRTNDQTPANILLITASAHGFIHNAATEMKLFRSYDMVVPGYFLGIKAEELEHAMYERLFNSLAAITPVYSAKDIINTISELDFDDVDIEQMVYESLMDSQIEPVGKTYIEQIVDAQADKYNSIQNVTYIDEPTGVKIKEVLQKLKDSDKNDEISIKSIETVIKFINKNMISRKKIHQYMAKH